jgi:dTDP-glucose 4,6-dehydratase
LPGRARDGILSGMKQQPILVTGGAGFIGSAVVRRLVRAGAAVVNVDCLTYAGNVDSLAETAALPNHHFEHADITDVHALAHLFATYRPRAVLHLAAESHVDRSIDAPDAFIQTNLVGTFHLLQEARRHYESLPPNGRGTFRFVHVSTDEVFGSLGDEGFFDETTSYAPRSPYSASKAGSDHLARAWSHTFGLPVIVTNCSNNYGPYQFPEKLIPLMILTALRGDPLPVYGDGSNVRDWIFVEDHVDGLLAALERGAAGETYLFGGGAERRNIEVVRTLCALLDELAPDARGSYARLISFVPDRPGHDFRYAIDATRTSAALGWAPCHSFESGLRETVAWYLTHRDWVERVQSGAYRGERLGLVRQS